MALRVWLPLNGNLENKGLSNYSLKTMGTEIVFNTNGKIGKSVTFPNSPANCLYINGGLKMQNLTWTCWFKSLGAGSGTSQRILSEGRDTGNRGVEIWLSKDGLTLNAFARGKSFSTSTTINTWHHVALVAGDAEVSLYLDGALINTVSPSAANDYAQSSDAFVIGKMSYSYTATTNYFPFNGYINDVRVYDECLSSKQIKEISKGLIAHYKLAASGINNNLAVDNPLVSSGATSVSYNNSTKTYTIISPVGDSTWGYGLNIGTGNKCLVPWNSTYRFSFEVWVPTEHEIRVDYNNYANTGSSWSGNDNDLTSERYQDYARIVPGQTWTKLIFGSKNAHTGNTDHVDIYEASKIGLRTMNDTESVTWYLRNFKFELGDTVTPYVPHEYNQMEWVAQDGSGNGYNGTVAGTLSYSADSPRYNGCNNFSTASTYLKLPILNTAGFANSFTIIYWAKIADMTNKMAWGFEDGNRLNIYPTGSVICCNTGDGANNPYQKDGTSIGFSQWNNGWHQFAMTADGTSNKLYVDGVLQGTAKTYKGITGTQIYLSGWASSNSYRWTDGFISDFRIYATALSADEILTMYKNSGIIDNKGNVYAYEFKEE